jgi:hypothetical protein
MNNGSTYPKWNHTITDPAEVQSRRTKIPTTACGSNRTHFEIRLAFRYNNAHNTKHWRQAQGQQPLPAPLRRLNSAEVSFRFFSILIRSSSAINLHRVY